MRLGARCCAGCRRLPPARLQGDSFGTAPAVVPVGLAVSNDNSEANEGALPGGTVTAGTAARPRKFAAIVRLRRVCKGAKTTFDEHLVFLISNHTDAAATFFRLWDRALVHRLFGRSVDSAAWLLKLAIAANKGLPIPYPIGGLLRSMKRQQAIALIDYLCRLDAKVVLGFQKPFVLHGLVEIVSKVTDIAENDFWPTIAKLAVWAAPVKTVGACFRGVHRLTHGMDMDMLFAFAPHCFRLCGKSFGGIIEGWNVQNIAEVLRASTIGYDFLDDMRTKVLTTEILRDNIALQQWLNAEPLKPLRARSLLVRNPDGLEWPELLRKFVNLRAASWPHLYDEIWHASSNLEDADFRRYLQASDLSLVLGKACERDPNGLQQLLRPRVGNWHLHMYKLADVLQCLPLERQERFFGWLDDQIAAPDARRTSVFWLELKEALTKQAYDGGSSEAATV